MTNVEAVETKWYTQLVFVIQQKIGIKNKVIRQI